MVRRRRPPAKPEPEAEEPPEEPELVWLSVGARGKAKTAYEAELAAHAEEYVELAFEAKTIGVEDNRVLQAAADFDRRYKSASSAATHQLIEAAFDPGFPSVSMVRHLRELRYHVQFFVPESAELTYYRRPPVKRRGRKAQKWSLLTSCWKERAVDPGEFFETTDLLRRIFDFDWEVAIRSHGLDLHIVKLQRDPTTWRDIDKNGIHDEIDEVRAVLSRHQALVYGVFDYLAALFSDHEHVPGEPDIFNITFQAFMTLVRSHAPCSMLTLRANVPPLF